MNFCHIIFFLLTDSGESGTATRLGKAAALVGAAAAVTGIVAATRYLNFSSKVVHGLNLIKDFKLYFF